MFIALSIWKSFDAGFVASHRLHISLEQTMLPHWGIPLLVLMQRSFRKAFYQFALWIKSGSCLAPLDQNLLSTAPFDLLVFENKTRNLVSRRLLFHSSKHVLTQPIGPIENLPALPYLDAHGSILPFRALLYPLSLFVRFKRGRSLSWLVHWS